MSIGLYRVIHNPVKHFRSYVFEFLKKKITWITSVPLRNGIMTGEKTM